MEAISLSKYWRSGGGGGGGFPKSVVEQDSASTQTTFTTAVSPCSSDGEDGPYFDLEFSLPHEDETDAEEDDTTPKCHESARKTENGDETEDGSRAEEESENENGGDPKYTVESSSILLDVSEETSYSSFPVSLLKSATKIRVLLLKFKKSRTEKSENNETTGRENVDSLKFQENQGAKTSGKFFTVKFKVEEVKAPLISLFTRDNTSKVKHGKGPRNTDDDIDLSGVSDDKKLIQKYLKMVKPLYVRVSKRYVEKLKFSGQMSFSVGSKVGGAASSPPHVAMEEGVTGAAEAVDAGAAEAVDAGPAAKIVKTSPVTQVLNGAQTGPKVMQKHLGKSRSALAAVASQPTVKMAVSDRRDDSLLQVQDGIQDAILHCKRSFQRL
ncbi:putative membrane-associated kinase regulator 2 [Dorcoceras hygrometricum]|uniref:Putative membrane-associated kinase regulator 2 n=1 Tax=Dorcoceras hygrometricum TaxID=472368 RepID=A0A2Z7BHC0_9LAMI|nr:putative membrane-associated kinase regulator 2 [Dorcoceras hygrometricum]